MQALLKVAGEHRLLLQVKSAEEKMRGSQHDARSPRVLLCPHELALLSRSGAKNSNGRDKAIDFPSIVVCFNDRVSLAEWPLT